MPSSTPPHPPAHSTTGSSKSNAMAASTPTARSHRARAPRTPRQSIYQSSGARGQRTTDDGRLSADGSPQLAEGRNHLVTLSSRNLQGQMIIRPYAIFNSQELYP